MFSMINRGRIKDLAVVQEFEHLFGRLRGLFGQSFDADGNLIIADPNLAITPLGGIIPYAGAAAPTGWLLCNGAQVSRVTYQSLFDLVGTTYGAGDGSTTFTLPDLRQRFPLGKAAAGTGSALGATGGDIDHTHSGGAHTHSTPAHSHSTSGTAALAGEHSHTVDSHTHNVGNHQHGMSGLDHPTATSTAGGSGVQAGSSFDAAVAGHAHFTVSGSAPSTDSAGATATTAASPATDTHAGHTHSVSGSTDTSGAGTTGSASGTTGSANPPFLALNYLIFAGV